MRPGNGLSACSIVRIAIWRSARLILLTDRGPGLTGLGLKRAKRYGRPIHGGRSDESGGFCGFAVVPVVVPGLIAIQKIMLCLSPASVSPWWGRLKADHTSSSRCHSHGEHELRLICQLCLIVVIAGWLMAHATNNGLAAGVVAVPLSYWITTGGVRLLAWLRWRVNSYLRLKPSDRVHYPVRRLP